MRFCDTLSLRANVKLHADMYYPQLSTKAQNTGCESLKVYINERSDIKTSWHRKFKRALCPQSRLQRKED